MSYIVILMSFTAISPSIGYGKADFESFLVCEFILTLASIPKRI
jgi:hypothetical protein